MADWVNRAAASSSANRFSAQFAPSLHPVNHTPNKYRDRLALRLFKLPNQ